MQTGKRGSEEWKGRKTGDMNGKNVEMKSGRGGVLTTKERDRRCKGNESRERNAHIWTKQE